ncbi:hypothetical protein TOPH_05366 [Tolypocladium ophioglossoides CBS 100239]|uniref:Uncharacterized protein n=1 Tax=Tolypocladium ophioglossoides (strain CBS 100239) TaxID=1163406 RepID=A0A0L0N7D4_TOLOC|nr:hypothetical protein TOPH_05366 [Tolypocladium ophioglossoides CBS 100239]
MAPKSFLRASPWPLSFALAIALDPKCTSGSSFDMRYWGLQLPTGSDGSVDTINRDLQGRSGQVEGQIVLTAPGNPDITRCTTGGSIHCRMEPCEVNKSDGKNAAWDPKDTNALKVTMTVTKADDAKRYFKTGSYNQGKLGDGSEVHIAAISVRHS